MEIAAAAQYILAPANPNFQLAQSERFTLCGSYPPGTCPFRDLSRSVERFIMP
ncbi:MAG: hypothetical protein QOE96_189 [Blastocatellia bacterium]|jgi:hypothetical protein|nr:hypothetical protein [Blastocatellia bacterium]